VELAGSPGLAQRLPCLACACTSLRTRGDEEVGARVRISHVSSIRTYGARRVWHDLLAEGYRCGLHRIERLMRARGLRARPRRRGLPKDTGEGSVIADYVLDRQFAAGGPNQKWVAGRLR